MSFAHIDRYVSARLGLDLADADPGLTRVVESERRLAAEQSYGYVHALWFMWLADGRRVVSVPPGAGLQTEALARDVASAPHLLDEQLAEVLREPIDGALKARGLCPTNRVLRDIVFACNDGLLRMHPLDDCRRLTDDSIPAAEGLDLPAHCFPDGVVYGVVGDGEVTSCAFAHRAGVMEDLVCDVGVGTAVAFRRRGYARAAVSALVSTFTQRGSEARYSCGPNNEASIATARSVGFVPYATSLILSAPRVPEEGE